MNTKALIQELLEKGYPFTLEHKETHALQLYEEGLPLDDYYIVCKMTGEIISEGVDLRALFAWNALLEYLLR